MKIHTFGCTNYKPFRDRTVLELRPLTLLFGKNNSGKTALLRLPRLLLRALSIQARDVIPLEVDGLRFGRKFRDLIHGGQPHGSSGFEICLAQAGQRLDLRVEVQNIQDTRASGGEHHREYPIVSRFSVAEPEVVELRWEPGPDRSHRYSGHDTPLAFTGFLPHLPQYPFLGEWQERVFDFENRVAHLGPLRRRLEDFYQTDVLSPIGTDGGNAPLKLADNPDLVFRLSDWLQQHLDGWSLSLNHAASVFSCDLQRGQVSINASQAGQGIHQVLPILIQQLSYQLEAETSKHAAPSFLCLVEQPELHLHAAAQGPLGDLFLDTARLGHGRLMVETHSENLLLRVRRRIAEGLVNPELVAVYFVDEHPGGYSTVQRVNIDADGGVDWWPEGVFAEGYEEVKAMGRAIRKRRHTQDRS